MPTESQLVIAVGGQGSCDVPRFDPTPPHVDQLGTSTLYVYSHLSMTSPCSGEVNTFKLCYEITATSTDTEMREVATVLILNRTHLRVREVVSTSP